jgi:hypothetical protein
VNAAGIVLVLAGVLVVSQVLFGDAIGRLGLLS